MSGGEDQQGDREVWSLHRPYLPVKVLFFLVLDPTPLTLVQQVAKAELHFPVHNGTSGSCTAAVHKLETGAKSGEPSPVFLGFSAPLASEAVGWLEVGGELVGMQEYPEEEIFCPQGDQTPKGFSHAGQQVPGAGLAQEQPCRARVLSCPVCQGWPHTLLAQGGLGPWLL